MVKCASQNFQVKGRGGEKKQIVGINCKVCVGQKQELPKFTKNLRSVCIFLKFQKYTIRYSNEKPEAIALRG